MQKILSAMRRAIQDYKMISDGDKIFVGLSGGKDSVLLLNALAAYRRFSPERFTLEAITIDMGLKDTKPEQMQALAANCASIDVPHRVVKTDIAEIIFDARKESNPCSLCAKLRRGALNSAINDLGGGKLALGHNADDVAETMLMSLLYEGRFSCFSPTAYMDKSGVSLIRPLIYLEECDIKSAVERLSLPIVHNPCPMNHVSKREYMKNLIKDICKDIPFAKDRILGAIYHPERSNLDGWDTSPTSDTSCH
ncbi:MAG: tRNA 2-thiocytidine biosynthesis TtcA family protein [Bacteroides sp.]|nr:tRNA 2-thiocytidine biosynthesis TtcA family protein [[Eubacterium] siraeum]MCM1454935.1 tRNA 2-thiocytidine biosynthesis TtcA family protein [Bacteroides sp.]